VWAFGPNVDPVTGGLGNGFGATRPVRVTGLPQAQQVAMGSTFNSWALARDGTVWGWGFINDVKGFAQGPDNTKVTFPTPVQVLMAAGTPIDRVCQVSATAAGAFMVRSDTPGGTCAANEPRSVWFTGDSTAATGQIGGSYATPLFSLAGNGAGLPTGRWIVEVITSRDYSDGRIFARASDGTVYAWGGNSEGQLGTGDIARRTVPTIVAGWQGATRLAVGGSVTLALMPDGSIKGAGSTNGGNLGIGTGSTNVLTPTVLAAPTGASDVSASYNYPNTMALVGGRLLYWGGGGRFSSSAQFTPIPISAPATPLAAVSVADYHALAIGPGGAVYAWGDYGALGCGNYVANVCDNTQVPQLVRVP
jgi:alpha-tubulin suppressor-like RCC1 family protein